MYTIGVAGPLYGLYSSRPRLAYRSETSGVKALLRSANKLLSFSGYKLRKIQQKQPETHQIFSIGMFEEDTAGFLAPMTGAANPVLKADDITDIPAHFVADPFMIRVDGVWYMFFEIMNKRTRRGEIGLAVSRDLVQWTYERIVLTESFHLSYPYVFSWEDDFYLIPETWQTRTVRLYQAVRFPYEWRLRETLISGELFLDASPFYHEERWWMFTETNPQMKFDTLRLFYANDLFGKWSEHPKSPVVKGDPRKARPAGRVQTADETIVRYYQNCKNVYGLEVGASHVTGLTEQTYSESPIGRVLSGSGSGWNAGGMHHVDLHRNGDNGKRVACVDGWYMVTE